MDLALRIAAIVGGGLLIVAYFRSIIIATLLRTQREDWFLASVRFLLVHFFRLVVSRNRNTRRITRMLYWWYPVTQITLMFAWFGLALTGFAGVYWGTGSAPSLWRAVVASGSALSTLGFDTPTTAVGEAIAIIEGATGLFAMVYLITFFPGTLAYVQARDAQVSKLYARTGVPPSGAGLLQWLHAQRDPSGFEALWAEGEDWFRSLAQTNLLAPVIILSRPFRAGEAWAVAAGALLDAAALTLACYDTKANGAAEVFFRTGVDAIQSIHRLESARTLPFPADESLAEAWQLTRERFDAALDALSAAGAPLSADRESAWRSFVARRAEYDGAIAWLLTNVVLVPAPALAVIPR